MKIFTHLFHDHKKLISVVITTILLTGCAATVPKSKVPKQVDLNKKKAMDLFIDGKMAEAKEQYGDAIASYIEALQYDSESEDVVLALVSALIESKKIRSALYYTRLAIKINPDNPDTWLLLQQLEQHEGRTDKAAEALEMYMKLSPDTDFTDVIRLAWYYFELDKAQEAKNLLLSKIKDKNTPSREMVEAADLLVKKGHTEEALSIYSRMLERDPMDVEAWTLMGRLYAATNRLDEAINTYQKGLEKNPDSISLLVELGNLCLEQNDWECAINYFKQAEPLADEDIRINIHKTLCSVYFYAGRDDEALALFVSLREHGDDDAAFYFSLGKVMNFLRRYEEAVNYFQRGFEHDFSKIPETQLFNVYQRYANALINLQRHDDAIKLIRDTASEFIKNSELLNLLEASIYLDMKRYEDAIAIYEWLVASDPQNISNIIRLGQTYSSAKQYKKAEETLLRVHDIDPENIAYLFQLSLVYDTSNQFKKAEKALLDILKKEPDNDLALNNLAYMYIEHDTNISKAISMVKRSLTIQPRNGAYHDTLGWGYYKKGKYEEAKKHIENALKLEDVIEQGIIYDHYGDILVKLGMKKEAIKAYRNAIELGEDVDKIKPKLDSIEP